MPEVGVGDDELDAVEPGLHHAVTDIAAAAADADHLDARAGAAAFVESQPQCRVLMAMGLPLEKFLEQSTQPSATRPNAPAPTGRACRHDCDARTSPARRRWRTQGC